VLAQTEGNNEGLIVGGAWNYDNPAPSVSSQQFVAAFEEANDGARPDQFAAQAYTGAWLAATAIRCADSVDHDAVNTAIGGITDVETPLGVFSFDADGEPVHDPIADRAGWRVRAAGSGDGSQQLSKPSPTETSIMWTM
jgi:ABC-type branched-subunit amino acid transport system substrate-binding protein